MYISAFLPFLALVQGVPVEEQRLISVTEGQREWMTESQIFDLIANRKHFIDITDGELDFFESHSNLMAAAAPNYPSGPSKQTIMAPMLSKVEPTYFKSFLDKFTAYNTRYYTSTSGVESAQYLVDEVNRINQEYPRSDVELTVEKFTHSWAQFSVIAKLTPKVVVVPERIIIGAHQDSVNKQNPSSGRAPGLDDDASGCGVQLNVLRLLMANADYVPLRPIEFQFYAAEEAGLKGSQAIAQKYVQDQVPVFGMLQIDMTGYSTKNPRIAIMTDNSDPALTTVLKFVAKEYTSLPQVETKCNYGCSDHFSFFKAGFPTAMAAETTFRETNPSIHTTADTFDKIAISHCMEFVKNTLGFIVELSLFK